MDRVSDHQIFKPCISKPPKRSRTPGSPWWKCSRMTSQNHDVAPKTTNECLLSYKCFFTSCLKTQWTWLLIIYLFPLSGTCTHTTLFSQPLFFFPSVSLPTSLCACVLSFPSHGAPVFSKQDRPPLDARPPPIPGSQTRSTWQDFFPLLPAFSHPLSPSVSLTPLSWATGSFRTRRAFHLQREQTRDREIAASTWRGSSRCDRWSDSLMQWKQNKTTNNA